MRLGLANGDREFASVSDALSNPRSSVSPPKRVERTGTSVSELDNDPSFFQSLCHVFHAAREDEGIDVGQWNLTLIGNCLDLLCVNGIGRHILIL